MNDQQIRQEYLEYRESIRGTQYEGTHSSDCENVPMTLEEFAEYLRDRDQVPTEADLDYAYGVHGGSRM